MDKSGFVHGYVDYIDPHSLDQIPVPDALVTFMQNRRIVAQAKSGRHGFFSVKGLTPYATYSLFVRSPQWVCVFGTYVLPVDAEVENSVSASQNRLVFVSLPEDEEEDTVGSATGDPAYHAIQTVPWQDFLSALRQGVFGDLGVGIPGPPITGPIPGVGGGGGGGGGGAAGAGAAAAVLGGAAAAGGDGGPGRRRPVATPFEP
jgi:hypothetical protein